MPSLAAICSAICGFFIFAGAQVLDRAAGRQHGSQGGLLGPWGDPLGMRTEVLGSQGMRPQVAFHAAETVAPQSAAKHQSVEARQHSLELVLISGDKIVPGVSFLGSWHRTIPG